MKWLTPKKAAEHAQWNYRSFLKALKGGQIRSVKRGRHYLTTEEWVDNYLLSLEEESMLVAK